jgi:hypothetical protein
MDRREGGREAGPLAVARGLGRPLRGPGRAERDGERAVGALALGRPLRLPQASEDVSWPCQCERLAHLNP